MIHSQEDLAKALNIDKKDMNKLYSVITSMTKSPEQKIESIKSLKMRNKSTVISTIFTQMMLESMNLAVSFHLKDNIDNMEEISAMSIEDIRKSIIILSMIFSSVSSAENMEVNFMTAMIGITLLSQSNLVPHTMSIELFKNICSLQKLKIEDMLNLITSTISFYLGNTVMAGIPEKSNLH